MRKPADVRKSEIVTRVLALADRIGPDRVTTAAVAADVGVTQAAIFRHFPTKAALWKAVAEHVADRLSVAWAQVLSDVTTPRERIAALIRTQLGQIAATPAMPMLIFSRELNVENADLRAAFRGRLKAFHGLIEAEVVVAQRLGAFRCDIAPADAALLLTSLVQGVAIRWTLGARDFPLATEGGRLLDVYMRLLATKGA